MSHVKLNGQYFQNASAYHVALVMRLCPNLEVLRLENLYFRPHEVSSNVQLLSNENCSAKELYFNNCNGLTPEWAILFSRWTSVRSLSFSRCKLSDELQTFIVNVKTLEKFSLNENFYQLPILDAALNRHRLTLRSLSLIGNGSIFTKYPLLIEDLPNLEYLDISINREGIVESLRNLKRLRRLKLRCNKKRMWGNYEHRVDLTGISNLEELDLVALNARMIITVANIRTLRILRIRNPDICNHQTSYVLEMVAKIPNLQLLHLEECWMLTGEDVATLVDLNRSIKEIRFGFFDFCIYDNLPPDTIPALIETLSRQAAESEAAKRRLPLQLTIEYNFINNSFLETNDVSVYYILNCSVLINRIFLFLPIYS